MKTTDLFKNNRSSRRLNESMEKTFGKKLNLESFDLTRLEDARNKLRTQISQVRSESGFNENLENDAYTQAQWMLDAINSEIAEREEFIADAGAAESSYEEGSGSMEDEVKNLLARFEQNAMEMGAYGDPDLDKIVSLIQQGDFEGAAGEVYGAYADQDGGEVPRIEPYIEDLQDEFEMLAQGSDEEGGETDDDYAMTSAGHGSDEDYGEFPEGYEQIGELSRNTVKSYAKKKMDRVRSNQPNTLQKVGKDLQGLKGAQSRLKGEKPTSESVNTGDNMTNRLQEGEIQQAQSIVTAKTMVDRVGRWIEELSGMENDTLLQLGDQIRDEQGQEQAKGFIESVAPAIQQALENLKSTREALASGVRQLTGEEQGAEMLGAEPTDQLGGDELGAAEPDAMNTGGEEDMGPPEDEFAAADPAAGAGDAGRAKRESIERQNKLLKVLAG